MSLTYLAGVLIALKLAMSLFQVALIAGWKEKWLPHVTLIPFDLALIAVGIMAPRLRVLAGDSLDNLVPISDIVNTEKAHAISSDAFQGKIVVNIKDFADSAGQPRHSKYFDRADRQHITWSLQIQGEYHMINPDIQLIWL